MMLPVPVSFKLKEGISMDVKSLPHTTLQEADQMVPGALKYWSVRDRAIYTSLGISATRTRTASS